MGTSGTITLISNGESKTVYNHYDSYANVLGLHVLGFARTLTDERTLDSARVLVRNLTPVPDTHGPDEEQAKSLEQYHENVSEGNDWYAYLRKTQGNIPLTLHVGLYEPFQSGEEYDYTLDLDAQTITAKGYSDAVTYPFSALPTDAQFEKDVEQPEGEDED